MNWRRLHRTFLIPALALLVCAFGTFDALAKTTVTEKDCVITITLQIQISGANATQALADKIEKEIEDCYNGQNFKYDCCEVKFDVKMKVGGAADPNYHQITIHHDPGVDTYVDSVDSPLPTPNGGSGSGNWGDSNSPEVYAHEAGHLMGLTDKYKKKPDGTTSACAGHENDKMGTLSGKPQQSDINSIIEAAGVKCPDKCKEGKASSTDSGAKDTAQVTLPTTGQSVIVAISPQATVSTTVEVPASYGGGEVLVGPFTGSMTLRVDGPPDAEANPFLDPAVGSMEVLEFDFVGPPVELPNGITTGDVVLSLNTAETQTSLGRMNVETGAFSLDIRGFIQTTVLGEPRSMPFESRINGQYDPVSGFTEFQCETLIVVEPESDTGNPDQCNPDEVPDLDGLVRNPGTETHGATASCPTRRVLRFYHGKPQGGGLRAVVTGMSQSCVLEVPTFAGDTAQGVMERFAEQVATDKCLHRQGIRAQTSEGMLMIRGVGVSMQDEILDPGLERLHTGEPLYLPAGD